MNWRAIRALIYKDLGVVLQSKAVLLPAIIVPLIFVVVLPIVMAISMRTPASLTDVQNDFEPFLDNLPAHIVAEVAVYPQMNQQIYYLVTVYQFAALFLIIPLMMANVIAADSFVGEKERKTLEALLYTPTTDFEIYLSKVLVALIPAVFITILCGVIYCVIVNGAGYSFMGHIFLPTPLWFVLILWVSPAAAGLGLCASVFVSSRVNTFQEASQVGGVIVLPVVALLLAQVSGLFYLNTTLLFVGGGVLWVIDLLLLWYGISRFQRGELVARL